MKIYPRKYEVSQGSRLCCIQCGRTCRTRTGKVTRIYYLNYPNYPASEVLSHYNVPSIMCRVCFMRGPRKNSLGGIRLYDAYSGQPYDQHGMIPFAFGEFVDPWKVKK